MPFKKNDPNINTRGRRKGSRNRVDPQAEYERAFNSGMSYSEIIILLSDKIKKADENNLSENELIKYIGKLLDVKKDVAKEYLQILKDAEAKEQESEKGEPKSNNPVGGSLVQFKTKAN